MTKILVPTDFSLTAEKACRFAVNLATSINAEIVLFHVYTPLENPYIESEDSREKYNKKMRLELTQELTAIKEKMAAEFAGVPISTELGRSPITDTIVEYAQNNNFNLIVMGTQGASGLKKVLIGSEAARIIEDTKVPVLLVPEKFTGTLPETIIFSTTCDVEDKEALEMVLELSKPLKSKVKIIHMCEEDNDDNHANKHEYDSIIKKYSLDREIDFQHMDTSYLTDTMEELDEIVPYDMMAMVRRKRNFLDRLFLKSKSKHMAYLTDHPLLVVPEK